MAIVNSNYAALTDYFHINLPDSSSRKSVLFAKEVGLKKMNLVKKCRIITYNDVTLSSNYHCTTEENKLAKCR